MTTSPLDTDYYAGSFRALSIAHEHRWGGFVRRNA